MAGEAKERREQPQRKRTTSVDDATKLEAQKSVGEPQKTENLVRIGQKQDKSIDVSYFPPTVSMASYVLPLKCGHRMFWVRYSLLSLKGLGRDYSTQPDRKSTRLNSSHVRTSRMPSSA